MFRLIAALVVLAAACAGAVAQTATVVELKAEDAALAKRLYAEKAGIEKQIADLEVKIRGTYLKPACDKNSITFCAGSPTWYNGFEYSTDFKFIVPKPQVTTLTCGSSNFLMY